MTTTGAPADLATFGRWARDARLAHGWSKEEAARRAGISPITLKRVEGGLPVQDTKISALTRALVERCDQPVPPPASRPALSEAQRTRCTLESVEFNDDGSTSLKFRSWDFEAAWRPGDYAVAPFVAASDSPPGAVGLGLVPPESLNPTEMEGAE